MLFEPDYCFPLLKSVGSLSGWLPSETWAFPVWLLQLKNPPVVTKDKPLKSTLYNAIYSKQWLNIQRLDKKTQVIEIIEIKSIFLPLVLATLPGSRQCSCRHCSSLVCLHHQVCHRKWWLYLFRRVKHSGGGWHCQAYAIHSGTPTTLSG